MSKKRKDPSLFGRNIQLTVFDMLELAVDYLIKFADYEELADSLQRIFSIHLIILVLFVVDTVLGREDEIYFELSSREIN